MKYQINLCCLCERTKLRFPWPLIGPIFQFRAWWLVSTPTLSHQVKLRLLPLACSYILIYKYLLQDLSQYNMKIAWPKPQHPNKTYYHIKTQHSRKSSSLKKGSKLAIFWKANTFNYLGIRAYHQLELTNFVQTINSI